MKDLKREYELRALQHQLYNEFLDEEEMKRYYQRFFELISWQIDLAINESKHEIEKEKQIIIALIKNNTFEIVDESIFKNSMSINRKDELFHSFSELELSKSQLLKLKEYNIGFAIKSDGSIIAIHNNSGINGLNYFLLESALKYGGLKLDCFDGILTPILKTLGFKICRSEEWNEDYAPLGWKYESVDINTSIYSEILNSFKEADKFTADFNSIIKRYKNGMPDVIYYEL